MYGTVTYALLCIIVSKGHEWRIISPYFFWLHEAQVLNSRLSDLLHVKIYFSLFPMPEHSRPEEKSTKQAEVSKVQSCEDAGSITAMELKKGLSVK